MRTGQHRKRLLPVRRRRGASRGGSITACEVRHDCASRKGIFSIRSPLPGDRRRQSTTRPVGRMPGAAGCCRSCHRQVAARTEQRRQRQSCRRTPSARRDRRTAVCRPRAAPRDVVGFAATCPRRCCRRHRRWCPRRCCRTRSAARRAPHDVVVLAGLGAPDDVVESPCRRSVPHTMLSQSAPPHRCPRRCCRTRRSRRPCPRRCCRPRRLSVPQTMLSPSASTVPQTMLSAVHVRGAPHDVVALGGAAVRAPHDVVAFASVLDAPDHVRAPRRCRPA